MKAPSNLHIKPILNKEQKKFKQVFVGKRVLRSYGCSLLCVNHYCKSGFLLGKNWTHTDTDTHTHTHPHTQTHTHRHTHTHTHTQTHTHTHTDTHTHRHRHTHTVS